MEEQSKNYEQKTELLKALSHPLRLQIVHNLLVGGCRNVRCIESCTGQSQSTISQHLTRLKAAGVVTCERAGNGMYYQVANGQVAAVVAALFDEREEEYTCTTSL